MKNVEVAIIGAGVSGLFLSFLLEQKGIEYLTVEKRTNVGKYGNRIISTAVLKSLDLTVADTLLPIKEIKFYSPSEFLISKRGNAARGYVVNLATIEKQVYSLIEDKTPIRFKDEANEIVLRNHRILTSRDEIKARVIVLANGVSLEDHPPKGFSKNQTKKVFCYGEEIEADESITVLLNRTAKGFYGWVMPIDSHKAEIGLGILGNHRSQIEMRERLFSLQYLKKYRGCKRLRVNTGFIPVSTVQRRAGKNWILVGDSSGGEPLMGGSIHKCLDEASMASETIEKFLNNEVSSCKHYERVWEKRLGSDARTQENLRELIDNSTNDDYDRVFKTLQAKEIEGKGLINDLFKCIVANLTRLKTGARSSSTSHNNN